MVIDWKPPHIAGLREYSWHFPKFEEFESIKSLGGKPAADDRMKNCVCRGLKTAKDNINYFEEYKKLTGKQPTIKSKRDELWHKEFREVLERVKSKYGYIC